MSNSLTEIRLFVSLRRVAVCLLAAALVIIAARKLHRTA